MVQFWLNHKEKEWLNTHSIIRIGSCSITTQPYGRRNYSIPTKTIWRRKRKGSTICRRNRTVYVPAQPYVEGSKWFNSMKKEQNCIRTSSTIWRRKQMVQPYEEGTELYTYQLNHMEKEANGSTI